MTSPSHLHDKLIQVMDQLDWLPKGGHNDAQKYDYTRQADVVAAVRAAVIAKGVTIVPTDMEVVDSHDYESKSGGRQHFVLVRVTWLITDAESGESVTVTSLGAGTDSGDKAPYKAMTGASKYSELLSFLIPTGDDPEKVNDTDSPAAVSNRSRSRGRQPQVPVTQAASDPPPEPSAPTGNNDDPFEVFK